MRDRAGPDRQEFAGPQDKQFKAPLNFYNVHYERHHLVGTSGGNTEDMRISLRLMAEGRMNPAGMITHVGGLDSAVQTILDLPDIPGGKKLVYTHVKMPMTAIADFAEKADGSEAPLGSIYRELDRICTAAEKTRLESLARVERWALVRGAPTLAEGPGLHAQMGAVIGTFQDINDRKLAELERERRAESNEE